MSRYDGNVGRGSERDYPFAVELPVPENGFGTQLDVMQGRAKERKITWTIGRNRFDKGRFFQTWRFTNEKNAAAFAAMFGNAPILSIKS